MGASAIAISDLDATGGQGQILLEVPPSAVTPDDRGLSYLELDYFEYRRSTSNNRDAGSTFGRSAEPFVHTGLGSNVTRYYWVRPVDKSGNVGDWYPASATGGISATTLANVPDNDSVGRNQLQDGEVIESKHGTGSVTTSKIDGEAVINGKVKELDLEEDRIKNNELSVMSSTGVANDDFPNTPSVPTSETTIFSDSETVKGSAAKVRIVFSGRVTARSGDQQAFGTVRIKLKVTGYSDKSATASYDEDLLVSDMKLDGQFNIKRIITGASGTINFSATKQIISGGGAYCRLADLNYEVQAIAK